MAWVLRFDLASLQCDVRRQSRDCRDLPTSGPSQVKAERGHLGTAIKAEVRAKAEARLKGEGRRPSLSQLLLKTDVKRESRREEKHEVKAKTERGAKECATREGHVARAGRVWIPRSGMFHE